MKDLKMGAGRDHQPAIYSCKVESLTPIASDGCMYRETEWHSFFGFVIDSVITEKKGLAEIEDKRTRLISWLLREPADGRQVNLRYVAGQDKGRLQIAVMGKCKDPSEEKSRRKALAMSENIACLLESFSVYTIKTIKKTNKLLQLMAPFEPAEIKTISRETLTIDTDYGELIAIHPFSFNEKSSLNDLLGMLIRHEKQILLDIAFAPVCLEKELRQVAGEVGRAQFEFEIRNPSGHAYLESYENDICIRRVIPLPRPSREGSGERQMALELMERQVRSLAAGALMMETNVASASAIPSAIVESIRYDLFGPAGRIKVEDSRGKTMDDTWRDIRFLNIQRLACRGEMLQNMVDLYQAKCVFQLPIPDEEGVRGVKAPRGTVRRSQKNRDSVHGS